MNHNRSRNITNNPDVLTGAKTDMSEWPPAGRSSSFMSADNNNYFARSEKILHDIESSLEKSRRERMYHK
jgi:hypothetical protein